MNTTINRRRFLRGALAGVAVPALALPALAQAPQRSLRPVPRPPLLGQPQITPGESLVAAARLDARVAYAVADARTGTMLEGRDTRVGLPPASVAKALTSLYALDALGPDHRFRTRLMATGPLREGRLDGDLVLAGGGDPTLDTNALATLAANLKAAGLREVTGRFLVWGGALPKIATIDPEQPDYVGYSPAVSGLNLNYNRVHFEWRRASGKWAVTMDARSDRYRPDVQMARMRIVERALPVYTYDDTGDRDDWTVASGALGNGGARWLPVRKPEVYAGEVFQTLARANGIVLKDPVVVSGALPDSTELVSHDSEPLRAILKDMLLYSTNLTAEAVGLGASLARGGKPATLADSAGAMNAWARAMLKLETVALVDHSGLGGDSRITAEDMVKALVAAAQSDELKPLLKSIRLDEGGQKTGAEVVAKTGTLNFVSGLAGYETCRDGSLLAFAIFAADVPRREALSEAERERPPGARDWNGRAKVLQRGLLERWGSLYGSS